MTNTLQNVGLGLLATLATVAGGGAQAGYVYDGVHLMDGSDFVGNEVLAGDMINSLTEMGIPVVDGGKNDLPVCQPDEAKGSYTLGYYVPADNYMVICTNVAPVALQFETLTHEAVHVIQDARTGIQNDDLIGPGQKTHEKLVDGLADKKIDTIVSLYDKEDWVIETEAFFFEDKPEAVAGALQSWAF